MRGLALLKVGGLLCYSTCSLNPLENEAVVAALLKRCAGAVEIVDCSRELPELHRAPGLTSWTVMDDALQEHESHARALQRCIARRRCLPRSSDVSCLRSGQYGRVLCDASAQDAPLAWPGSSAAPAPAVPPPAAAPSPAAVSLTSSLDEGARRSLESWLSRVEQGASALRKAIKPERGDATVVDAAVAGAMVGFGTGKCLIGDPKLLALSGACSFAYAHRWPEKTDGRFRAVARRCSELAHEARAYMSGSC